MGFPEDVVDAIKPTLVQFLPQFEIIERPLRHGDPAQSLGIFPVDVTPNQSTIQMGDQAEPVLNMYEFRVQILIKATDEILGRQMFGTSSKVLRVILYRDPALIVRLAALNETILGTTESMKRFGVRRQRFLNNELQGRLMWLASTDFFLETETRRV